MTQKFPLVLIGGNNMVGGYVMSRLNAEGLTAEVISRRPIAVPPGFSLTHMDLTTSRNWIAPENAVIVSMLPLWVLAQFLPRFIGVNSIVAIGSTSQFSKATSEDLKERSTAASLEQSEAALRVWCARSNVHYTLLRPTMIYDGISDQNIARMARFIRRFRCLPLAAPAKGLRQPIHADDVAKAIINSINNEAAYDKAVNIAGGEVMTYRTMAERVFAGLGMKPRLLLLPISWLEKAFRGASKMGVLNEQAFGSSIFQRMNEDLIFDTTEGSKLLNYKPRNFDPTFKI